MAGSGAKSWRLGTVVQGFAGSEAPTRAAHRRFPAGSGAKSWRLVTVVQGFAGGEAPTRMVRRPTPARKVDASERWFKTLPGVRRQLGWPAGRRLLTPGNEKTAEPETLLVTPRALPRFPDVLWPCRFGCGSRIRSPGSVSSRRCFSSRRRTGFP